MEKITVVTVIFIFGFIGCSSDPVDELLDQYGNVVEKWEFIANRSTITFDDFIELDETILKLSEKENPEEKVIGLYSGPGLYGMGGATVELLYGGSFVMKDPYLPEGDKAFGDWTISGSNVDFYMDARLSFSARIVDEGLIISGKKWEKVR